MDTRVVEWIEGIASFGAAAIFAVAVAYAVSRLTPSALPIGAVAAAALFFAMQILRSIAPDEREMPLAEFEPAELVIEDWDELLLTEAERIDEGHSPDADDELVLDDVLAELGEESRVVRLFDRSAMPTPGQLRTRIDRHLNQAHAQEASSDASEALHEALAKLRHSLK